MTSTFSEGLRDVEAVESSITAITREGLFFRGIPLARVLQQASFEEVAFLLWHGRRPSTQELRSLRLGYAKAWLLPPEVVAALQGLPATADPMHALQVAIPLLALTDPERHDGSEGAEERRAMTILAQAPAVVACRHWGMPVARLDPEGSLAAQALRALGSKVLPPSVADAALILFADHELAASTFAARLAAAARCSLYDGLGAAIAVLKGQFHGGSTLAAASLLRQLADSRQLDAAITSVLATTARVPGFGHSVYTAGDPRAQHFRALAEEIATGEARRWVDAAAQLERRVLRERRMHANVDLYAATFMHAAGLKDSMMLPFFAVARTAGWLAHMLEQRENNRLIRPRARYTGELDQVWEAP